MEEVDVKAEREQFTKTVMQMLKAQEQAEKSGRHVFKCPACGGSASWNRAESNNHLWISCTGCGFRMVE